MKGTYLYFNISLICLFMVMKTSTNQYSSSIGQKTGTSKMGKNVRQKPMRKALIDEYLQAGMGQSRQVLDSSWLSGGIKGVESPELELW